MYQNMQAKRFFVATIGIGAALCCAIYHHKHRDHPASTASAQLYSYHITMKLGDSDIMMWPMSGFGQYVTDEHDCVQQLQIERQRDPSTTWSAYKYPAVVNMQGKVVGISRPGVRLDL